MASLILAHSHTGIFKVHPEDPGDSTAPPPNLLARATVPTLSHSLSCKMIVIFDTGVTVLGLG